MSTPFWQNNSVTDAEIGLNIEFSRYNGYAVNSAKYRFLLFDDEREVELVWNGKSADVCNIVLSFQTIEPLAQNSKKS